MDKFPHWIDHILAFVLCIGIPLYGFVQKKAGFAAIRFNSEQKKSLYLSGSFSLFLMGFVVLLEWLSFSRPLAEIGLTQPSDLTAWWWMPIIFVAIYLADTMFTVSSRKRLDKSIEQWKKRTPFLPTKSNELPEYFLLCFSAGIFEEIAYRGYLITYCWYLFADNNYQEAISIILPALVFSIAHFYQGTKAVIKIFILAIVFGYLFLYSGSLLIVMILHFLVDAAGGLLSIRYFKDVDQPIGEENNFS